MKRKPINIRGEHAFVRSLRPEEKKVFKRNFPIVKRTVRYSLHPPAYGIAITLARLLYPKNFPLQIASDRQNQRHYLLKKSKNYRTKPERH